MFSLVIYFIHSINSVYVSISVFQFLPPPPLPPWYPYICSLHLNSSEYIPTVELFSFGNSMFKFLRKCQIVFHSTCTILLTHQQCTRIPVSPHSHQPLFSFYFVKYSLYSGYELVSHCWFDLHFPND